VPAEPKRTFGSLAALASRGRTADGFVAGDGERVEALSKRTESVAESSRGHAASGRWACWAFSGLGVFALGMEGLCLPENRGGGVP